MLIVPPRKPDGQTILALVDVVVVGAVVAVVVVVDELGFDDDVEVVGLLVNLVVTDAVVDVVVLGAVVVVAQLE